MLGLVEARRPCVHSRDASGRGGCGLPPVLPPQEADSVKSCWAWPDPGDCQPRVCVCVCVVATSVGGFGHALAALAVSLSLFSYFSFIAVLCSSISSLSACGLPPFALCWRTLVLLVDVFSVLSGFLI